MTSSKIKGDISHIECRADGMKLYIKHTDEPYASVQCPRGVKIYFEQREAKLVVRHKKRLLAKLFGSTDAAAISIPGHMVPSVDISGSDVHCAFAGVILGDVNFSADSGSLSADITAMNGLTVNSAACDIDMADCTVKGNALISCGRGDMSFENTFLTRLYGRTQSGNIGAVKLNCADTILESAEGNIAATICGDERHFDVILTAKEGTCNRGSVNIEDNTASFKAYAAKGNIFVDFVTDKEN